MMQRYFSLSDKTLLSNLRRDLRSPFPELAVTNPLLPVEPSHFQWQVSALNGHSALSPEGISLALTDIEAGRSLRRQCCELLTAADSSCRTAVSCISEFRLPLRVIRGSTWQRSTGRRARCNGTDRWTAERERHSDPWACVEDLRSRLQLGAGQTHGPQRSPQPEHAQLIPHRHEWIGRGSPTDGGREIEERQREEHERRAIDD